MGTATVTVHPDELKVAEFGLRIQKEYFAVPDSPQLDAFLKHMTNVLAHQAAWIRYQNNLIENKNV